jgi:hypothetical protein
MTTTEEKVARLEAALDRLTSKTAPEHALPQPPPPSSLSVELCAIQNAARQQRVEQRRIEDERRAAEIERLRPKRERRDAEVKALEDGMAAARAEEAGLARQLRVMKSRPL